MKKLTTEQQELCKQYMPLVTYCLRKRFYNGRPKNMYNELVSDCYLALVRAAMHYNPSHDSKSGFANYACKGIMRQINRCVENESLHSRPISCAGFNRLDTNMTEALEIVRYDTGYMTDEKPFEYIEEVNLLLNGLSDRELNIVKKWIGYEGTPMTLKEIGEQLGISKQRACQIYHRAMKRIKENYLHRPF